MAATCRRCSCQGGLRPQRYLDGYPEASTRERRDEALNYDAACTRARSSRAAERERRLIVKPGAAQKAVHWRCADRRFVDHSRKLGSRAGASGVAAAVLLC
jgi:hypothetical protein